MVFGILIELLITVMTESLNEHPYLKKIVHFAVSKQRNGILWRVSEHPSLQCIVLVVKTSYYLAQICVSASFTKTPG